MKRGKPYQRYYTPGSGSLRKTNYGIEESESDTNLVVNSKENPDQSFIDNKFRSEGNTPRNASQNSDNIIDKFSDLSIRDSTKKNRKPDMELYVPRIVAQSKRPDQEFGTSRPHPRDNYSQERDVTGDNERNSFSFANGNEKRFESHSNERFNSAKSKRYSSNRRQSCEKKDYTDDWSERNNQSRQMRQGSEPRNSDNYGRESNSWQRTRDTRSMEHSGPSVSTSNYGDKSYPSKPPSGRRNSAIDKINELPPRFRKKMLEEGKLKNMNMQEDSWDGSSLTFQNTSNQYGSYSTVDNYQSIPGSYATLPNSHNTQTNLTSGNNPGFSTLPTRSRGRGRLNYEQFDYGSVGRPGDASPCHSRPTTPQPVGGTYRDDNIGRPTSRPHTPSYSRRNEYNKNNEDFHRPSSRQSSQERPRRNNYRDNHPNRHQEGDYSQRRNDMRSKDDSHQQNRGGDFRNNRRRNDHRDRRGRGDFRRDDYRAHPFERYNESIASRDASPAREDFCPNKDERYSGSLVSRDVSPAREDHSLLCEDDSGSATPVPASSPKEMDKTITANTENEEGSAFDWSEDVEKSCKEQEALSDAPSRSSSVISLVNNTTNQTSVQTNGNSSRKSKSKSKKKDKRRRRSRSNMRDRSRDRLKEPHPDAFHNFKVPAEPVRRKLSRDNSYDRFSRTSRNRSRECSFDRMRKSSTSECENWRDEIKARQEQEKEKEIRRSRNNSGTGDFQRSRNNSGTSDFQRSRQNSEDTQSKRKSCDLSEIDVKKAGVLVIPQEHSQPTANTSLPPSLDNPRYARKQSASQTKSLFDPNNPNKPIIVKSPNSRVAPGIPENKEITPPPAIYDMFGNICPSWYVEDSEENQMSHFPNMIKDVKRADQEIQYAIHSGIFLKNWPAVETFRQFLKESLQYFLCKDLKFSQTCNIEQHFWKLLYYNIIERIRKASQEDEANKEDYKKFVLYLVDEGTQYFEGLLKILEEAYQFQLGDFLGANQSVPQKGLGYVGLALISSQKILIFLGDLARYKEQMNETMNFGKSRQWYMKAHEINPKNGRPYKQLAHLAVLARRKLDAVYYYVRSLMSSNPIYSSREKLTSLFYENSKKYEQGEKKRHMKEKESEHNNKPKSLRKETWIRPDGGQRVHRTTQAVQKEDSEEDLLSLSYVEVNKRFVISYLHVHGKLITKIGMDSFQEAAKQMLKEFRALLQHSPLPLPTLRLLQLLALNMFAIESNQLKDPEQRLSGYRSEIQECALVVSLQMFNLILERCVSLLDEHLAAKPEKLNEVSMDIQVLLPPIKIWCDWMLCHSGVWNPPPSTQDFRVGEPVDPWTRLAMLINLLRQFDQSASSVFETEQREGYELLRLPEDTTLSGFTPLMLKVDEPTYIPKTYDVESAQFVLRLNKLLFFGTEFLCGLEPPVLKLEIDNDFEEYISVVSNANSRDSPQSVEEMNDHEVLVESYSDNESKTPSIGEDTSSEVRDLLTRKVELERWHKKHQLHMERVERILAQSIISVHIEVLPKYLVPDTNCFIDHLDMLENIIKAPNTPYTIMVPIVVLGELEGLGRGGISPIPGTLSRTDPEHTKKVGEAARKALVLLKRRHHNIKCVTTKGAVLNSTTFTTEDDQSVAKNDDKILNTCLNLSKIHEREMENKEGEPRQIFREVVLLTDDRNLRVKAHSTDVPVRELPDFLKWAGLG